MNKVFIILSCLLAAKFDLANSNDCPLATGCRCTDDTRSSGLGARCTRSTDPLLQNLPLQNVTRLTLSRNTFTNFSNTVSVIRGANLEGGVIFSGVTVPGLNWEWIPDTCSRVTVSRSPIIPQFYSPRVGACEIRSSLNVTRMFLTGLNYQHIPKCLPKTLTTLSLVTMPLLGFEGGNITDNYSMNSNTLEYPPKLRLLYIKTPQFTSIDSHVISRLPETVYNVNIGTCVNDLESMPSGWPVNNGMTNLQILNCGISRLESNDLQHLDKLISLQLNGNKLTTLDAIFPSSLTSFLLERNQIATINPSIWSNLKNMTRLSLNSNKLTSVPLNLPENLKYLSIKSNVIEFCDRQAFVHMNKLNLVDLSYNKLLIMPERLPITMNIFRLNNNELTVVRGPENYEFCYNCTILNLASNAWVCDDNMVRMLVWILDRPFYETTRITAGGFCNSIQPDIGSVDINSLLMYTRYIDLAPEFLQCRYEIKSLVCNSSGLTRFPDNPPNGLNIVDIINNPKLTIMPDNLYINQTQLLSLYLDFNGLTEFPRGLPSSLIRISIIGNNISTFTDSHQATFERLVNLENLQLGNNNIKLIYDYQVRPMTSLTSFGLLGNPLNCDCSLQSFVEWFVRSDLDNLQLQFAIPFCASPPSRQTQRITQLTGAYLYDLKCETDRCRWNGGIPTLNCSLPVQEELEMLIPYGDNFTTQSIPANKYWRTLDLSNIGLRSDEIHLQQLSELINLDLSGNDLTTIPITNFPSSLQNINLMDNQIAVVSLPNFTAEYLSNLETLDLRFNQITTLTREEIGIFHVANRVLLQGNPLICDSGLRSLISFVQSSKDSEEITEAHQLNELTCAGPPELAGVRLADLEDSDYLPAEVDVTKIAVSVTGSVILVFIIVVIINIKLYKRRKLQERKDIVQGFKDLLEQEALRNDEPDAETGVREAAPVYEYDAFVSYSSDGNDEEFVYKMMEELEDNRHRKICLHERDFIPGRSIAENIVECIGSSRRVILVISRKYAASGWCQYEVQVALAHLHKSRQGKLLIPILLEDLVENNNAKGGVQTILSLISGIPAPQPQASATSWKTFWNKLEAAVAEKTSSMKRQTSRQNSNIA